MIAHFLLPLIPPILPTDPRIVTVGRFDRTDPATIACQWPASEVRLRVKGAMLGVSADDSGKNLWQVVVDGKPTEVLALKSGPNDYLVSLGSDAIHDVSLVKRTESFVGTTRFSGFDVPAGGLFQAKRRSRLIEFVGDSITCGYGNEGASQNEHFTPETENAYQSYASVAGRAVGADVRLIAWSGRKMFPDNTMPEIYDRVLPTEAAPLADPKDPVPDVVVINLATNDFGAKNPDEAPWTAAYEAFIHRVRAQYAKTQIYVTLGGMMTDDYPPQNKALSTARGYLTRMVERIHDPKVHFVEFDRQLMEDGIGADWHPNLVTGRKMASRLLDAWEKDLHWKSKLEDPIKREALSRPFPLIPVMVALQSPSSKSAAVGKPVPLQKSKRVQLSPRKVVVRRARVPSAKPRVVAFRPVIVRPSSAPPSGRSPATGRSNTHARHLAHKPTRLSTHSAKPHSASSSPAPLRHRVH